MAFGLVLITLLVPDYDEAIQYYVHSLDFELVVDKPAATSVGNKPKRWVEIRPAGSSTNILLAQADSPKQVSSIGNQSGDRVGFFWHVQDFEKTYTKLQTAGVEFLEQPRSEVYGKVVVFQDLYGNKWDLMQPAAM